MTVFRQSVTCFSIRKDKAPKGWMLPKTLSLIDNLNETAPMAEIGCETGGECMVLVQNVPR